MLARKTSWVLALLVATTALGGCAAESSDDGAEGQTANVTGGSGAIESPVVYLFDSAARVSAKCAGAMLSDTIAVTAKSCAKEGLVVGRATDKDGKGKSAKVKAVHLPEEADADIAVVELDKPLAGTNAVITHMPLRAGYAVNGIASVDGKIPVLSPDKGEASSVQGSIIEENATHGSIVPNKGMEICDGDLGAPVCSSTSAKIAGFNIVGTCGLSGLVVGSADAAAAPAAPGAAAGEAASTCSGKAWKVAQLGRYADFLRGYAPKAFQPLRIDKPIIRNIAFAPEGLWGYQTAGKVKSCKIETTTLANAKAGESSSKIIASVTYEGMGKKAAAWGRFGIAPKSEPTKIRWMPAKATSATSATSFSTQFEGVVDAIKDGDYLVAFRASANGGESWTMCDLDGIDNGFSADQSLPLVIGEAKGTPTETTPPPAEETKPQDAPPSDGYSDPAPSDSSDGSSAGEGEEDYAEEEEAAPKKKDSAGCSVGPASSYGTSRGGNALPLAAAAVGLALVLRRRRERDAR